MNRGKSSSSPPVQLTGPVPARSISQYSVPPRGQTPPYREDFQPSSFTGHSYISPLPPGYLHGALPANLPHDMNKASVQQQHQQSSQRLTQGGAAQPQIMFTQTGPRPQNPQSMQGSYYGQPQANARAARPQMPMGMPQPTQMYMYMPPGPTYPGAPGPIMVPQGASPYFPSPAPGQRMPPNMPQYPVNTSQPNQQYTMGPSPSNYSYNSPTNTNAAMFFPQGQSMPMPQQQRPPSASSMASQQPYQKRERTMLKIVDPSTGKDIMDEIRGGTQRHTPPQSIASSARATPVSPSSTPSPPQQNEIAAQFAAQVAATLNPVPRQQQQPPPPHLQQLPQMGMQMPPPHAQYPPKPEGPGDGMATVQMPPKVPSPAQYPRSTVTPPNPQMMPPQTIVHAQQPPQHVIQAHTPHQGYKPQAHPQSAPHTPAQAPMHPHPAPPQSSVTQGSQEPVTVTEPSQPGNATVAAPVQDVPGQSPSVAPEAKAEKTEESVVPVPSGEKVKVSHPQDVPVVQDAPKETPKETVAEPSSTVIETESEERSSDVKQNTESAESKDSAEKDTKTVDATKDVGLAASANEGEKAPPVPKPEATQSAVVSEKLEKRTTPPGDSVSTTAPPPVTAEVKPVTSPPPETDTAATSQTGSSADAGEVSVEGKVTLPEETEVTEPAKSAVAVISSEVTERKEDREAVSEVKAVAKAKNKVRAKELNAKGETKQGSDMDLFLPDAPAKKADVDSAGSSGVEPEPIEEAQDKEPATPVHSSPPPTIMTSEEGKEVKIEKAEVPVDNRVVEENQKNEVKTNESSNGPTSTPASAQELKYQYKEDQWSPLNPEGKKCYDRAFLLELQYSTESVTKPEGLPHLPDVILDEPHSKKSNRSYDQSYHQSRAGSFDFTPGFVKPSPRGGSSSMGGGGGKNRSQQGRKEVKKITSVSIQQDIKLHKAENAWKPAQSVSKDDKSSDKAKTDDLYRRVTSILNKLTPQKFSTLLQQMTGLKIDTEERLKGVIDLIFEKAVSEPGFCVAYANMCKYLMLLKVPLEGKPGETVNFRKLLLNRCQREFQKDNREEIEYNNRIKEIEQAEESLRPQMMEELEIASTKARRRSLGNIRFIGELFKLKMLTENIMHECVLKLLKSHDEESLECLCRLLTTIGKELDTDKAKPRVDQYFQQMTKIVAQRKTSSRVRFMLQDVIDLRQNRWVPRRDENNPKTIDQIHKEVAQEAQEKAILIQQISSQPMHRGGRGGRGDRDRGGRPQGGGNMGEDGWSTVGVRAARATIDPTKLKLSKPQHVDENIQLGPGTRFASWGRGSSAGGTKSQEADRSSNPGNRFSALSSRGEDSHDPRSRGRGRGISPARSDMRSRNSSSRDPPRSKQGPRSSMEMERQSALATAKSYSASGRNTPPSREDSRENSRSREPRREEKPVSAPPPDMSDEEVEKKTKAIMDEYLHIQDSKEAEMCISELRSPENIYRFVAAALNHVIERSDVARRQTGNLLHDVVKKKLISVDCYVKGLGKVLEYAEDMEIDIPKIWTYLGELIGPMVQDGSVPLNFLKQVCDPLKQSNKAGVLVSEVLHDAAHRLGHLKVGELWKASSLVWTDFVPESDVKQFIKDKKLEFTLAEEAQPRSASVSSENIQSELERLLLTQNSDNEEVFDWIEGNVDEENVKSPQFIRCLMSLVCRSAIKGSAPACKVDETIIKKRGVLLQKYLDHQAELELQALYALQTLANKLEYPQGLLRSFFEILYDEDIISEDAFYQWEASKDAGEQEGKGVALKQVVQFFTWLGETEDESQEDS